MVIIKKSSLKIIIVSALLAYSNSATAQFACNWANRVGLGNFSDEGNSVKVDASGNVYITGDFNGTNVDFGGGHLNTSHGGQDIFFAKYDANGVCQWAHSIGGATDDVGESIAVDAAGNVFICGHFTSDTVDFDPGASVANLVTNGNWTIFVAKYDMNGNYMWAFEIPNPGGPCDAHCLTLDDAGSVYVTGYFQLTCNFDPSGTANLISNGGYDIFFAKYDNNGVYQWAKNFGSAGIGTIQETYSIALDATGNIYLTGYITGTANLDPVGTHNFTSNGASDIFLAKYNSSGVYQWGGTFGSTSAYNEQGMGICVDATGNVYITGSFCGTSDFDISLSGTVNITPVAAGDIFIAKYNSSGVYQWADDIGACGGIQGNGIAANNSSVFVTGYYQCAPDFDPSPSGTSLPTWYGGYDLFLASYDVTNGSLIGIDGIGNATGDWGNAVALDTSTNSVYITGYFSQTVNFNPSGTTLNLVSASNSEDVFLAKYNATIPLSAEETFSTEKEKKINIYPNPASNDLNYEVILKETETITLQIFDITGNKVVGKEFIGKKGVNRELINISSLSDGLYMIRVNNGTEQKQVKFIKQ